MMQKDVLVFTIVVFSHQVRPGADDERCRDRILLQHKEGPTERQTGAEET